MAKETTTKKKTTRKRKSPAKKSRTPKKASSSKAAPAEVKKEKPRARHGLAFAIVFMVIAFFGGFLLGKDTEKGFRFEELGDQDAQIAAMNQAIEEAEERVAELESEASLPESYALAREYVASVADGACDNIEVARLSVAGYPRPVPVLSVVGQDGIAPLNPGPEYVLDYLGHDGCDYYFYDISRTSDSAVRIYTVKDKIFNDGELAFAVRDIFTSGEGGASGAPAELTSRYLFALKDGVLYASEKNALNFVELGELPEGVLAKDGFDTLPRILSTTRDQALFIDQYDVSGGTVTFRAYQEEGGQMVVTEETVTFELP